MHRPGPSDPITEPPLPPASLNYGSLRTVPSTAQPKAATPKNEPTEKPRMEFPIGAPKTSGTMDSVPPSDNPPATTPHTRIDQAYEARRTLGTKILDVIGQVFTTPFRLVADALTTATNFVRCVMQTVIGWILDGLFALLAAAGVDTSKFASTVKRVVNAVISAPFGLLEGALRAPEIVVGAAYGFVRNFFSFSWLTSGRDALRTLFQPIIGGALTAISPLYYMMRNVDDAWAPPETVGGLLREQLLADFPPELVDRIRIHRGGFMRNLYLASGASAQTQGYDMYFANDDLRLDTLRHELVHALQMRDTPGRFGGFTSEYFATLLANGLTSKDGWNAAYREIPAEKEAYDLEY